MNIKTFLIENYIWLIVIILITIITIIGFLADKKRGGKKEKKVQAAQPQNVNNQSVNTPIMNNQQLNQTPMQYQQTQDMQINQTNANIGINNPPIDEINKPIEQINTNVLETQPAVYTQPQDMTAMNTVAETNNNPQPVENIIPNIMQEPMYQPLSEQKPVFEPQPIPNFSNSQQPLVNTELNQINSMPTETPPPSVTSINSQPVQNQTTQVINQTPVNHSMISNQQTQTIQNNNFGTIPNVIPNNTTIPQPVNPIPQQPNVVIPQPIMQNNYNQTGMMPQNANRPQPVEPQNMNMSQTGQALNQQPINFVYGPQNNNPNM